MAYTRSVSSASALSIGIGRFTRFWSRPSGMTSRAVCLIPARSSTSRRGTPVHSATPIPPSPHGVPAIFFPWDI